MDTRPALDKHISLKDFQDFYWLKAELSAFCQAEGLSRRGNKQELAERIVTYLTTGEKTEPTPRRRASSKFDWSREPLTRDTVITDNYKNTQNVRAFFAREIGSHFKFNTRFMNWMKSHIGYTLGEAVQQWHTIRAEQKQATTPKEIAPQFEYNRYIRDFMADNPTLSRQVAIQCWKQKRAQRGDNAYHKSDLALLEG